MAGKSCLQAKWQALKAWAVAVRGKAPAVDQEDLEAKARGLWGQEFDVAATELMIRLAEASIAVKRFML